MQKINHIAIITDRSGSTQSVAPEIIRQFNRQADLINEQALKSGQKTHLSFYTFSSTVDHPHLFEVPLGLVKLMPITSSTYQIGGMTALFDAVGRAIEDLSQFHRDLTSDDHSFLIMVLTDGEENQSKKYDDRKLNELIRLKQATDMWSFAFMVPEKGKQTLMRNFAIPEGNIIEWNTTTRGVQDVGKAASAAIVNYFTARSRGQRSVRSFFATDLSNVSATAVKKELEEVTTLFDSIKVTQQLVQRNKSNGAQIRDFCEHHIGEYTKGSAYYELTKPETVQKEKLIVVENNTSGKLYGGPSARRMIGLPEDGEIRVRPGDHGNFRIYVQSTSTNRKLVAGTSVLYLIRKKAGRV